MTNKTANPALQRRVHLIRHGETNWNRERRAQGQQESVLTDRGIAQAQALAAAIADLPIDEVFSSSSLRARQTTEILFAQRKTPTEYCDLLREIHMGDWEGRLYDEIEAADPGQFRAFWQEPQLFALQGAETFEELQQRAQNRLTSLLEQSSARELAIVSHGAWIKTLLCHIEPRPLAQLWHPPALHNCAHSIINLHDDGSLHISLYAGLPYPSDKPATDSDAATV